jgi:hypothetical protein
MSFLAPLFLALSLLAIPIVILYMLKLRRREVEVSSTMLWQMLLRDREANSPWQRLRRNLLLLLQLLLLAALVLALARPFWPVPTIATGTLVVLLDGSASMNALDAAGGGTRFEAARAAVRQLIDGLGPDGNMSLILVGQQPAVLVPTTASKDALCDGLSQARPAETPADWEAAVALAAGTVRAGEADDSIIVIISDGGLPETLPPMPTEVRYVPIGTSADNLAIEALALRPTDSGPQLFASVANHGTAERGVIISFYLDGQLFSAEQLQVPAGDTAEVVLDALSPQPAAYEARLSLPAGAGEAEQLDALPLDDTAYAVYQPPAAGRVLLVTPGNVFLEQVFAALSGNLGLSPFRLRAGQPLPAEPFDLYVFDGVISGTLPVGADVLLINPPDNELFDVGGTYTATTPVRVLPDPLTQFVDWSGVHLLQATDIALPDWARPLVQTGIGPLVFAGEQGGRRVAVLAFDLHDSNLPLQVTFPVLMANLLGYLAPAQAFAAGEGLRPGEPLVIKPAGGDAAVVIVDPGGVEYAAAATEAGVIFAQTNRLGFYTVRTNQGILGRFAVNLFDPNESVIAPADTIRIGRADVAAAARQAQGEFEIWPWLAVAALALLLIEWWVYHRGNVLPKLPVRKRVIGN